MPGNEERFADEFPSRKGFITYEQLVKLRSIGLERWLQVKDALENLLNFGDVLANGYFSTQIFFQVGCCADMVRLGVGF